MLGGAALVSSYTSICITATCAKLSVQAPASIAKCKVGCMRAYRLGCCGSLTITCSHVVCLAVVDFIPWKYVPPQIASRAQLQLKAQDPNDPFRFNRTSTKGLKSSAKARLKVASVTLCSPCSRPHLALHASQAKLAADTWSRQQRAVALINAVAAWAKDSTMRVVLPSETYEAAACMTVAAHSLTPCARSIALATHGTPRLAKAIKCVSRRGNRCRTNH